MPQLRPFRGLRYDQAAVSELAAVICPPYDVISPAERDRLAARHACNAIHVELPVNYGQAAGLFAAWQRDGILRPDDRASIYVYEQRFQTAGDDWRLARGFVCRLQLDSTGQSGVLAHERTMAAPKADRYQLLDAVRANLSPVVLLYRAPDPLAVADLLDRLTAVPPAAEATDDAGTRHRLWPSDPTTSASAAALLAVAGGGPLTIADGHHRYETAVRFRAEHPSIDGADMVMVLLYEANTGGLELLPTHRLVDQAAVDGDLLKRVRSAGTFHPLSSGADVWRSLGVSGIGVWSPAGGGVLELPGVGESRLAVAALTDALPELLGAERSEVESRAALTYTHDEQAAIEAVDAGSAGAAFLLRPPAIDDVLAHAAAGRTMPQKSTYFYPKAATGLVFNLLAA